MVPPDPQPVTTNSKATRDYVTAHKISLIVLIKEFCVARQQRTLERPILKAPDDAWVQYCKESRGFASTMLKLIQNPDMDLQRLISIIHEILNPTTCTNIIERLHQLRKNGIAALMDYMGSLDTLLVEPAPILPVIQKSSVLGLFIRHMILAFDKLTFSQVTKLYGRFQVYFDAAFGEVCSENVETNSNDSGLRDELEERSKEEFQVLASQKQAEFFIAQQAALLQINESAALSPKDLQKKINELMKGNPELYEACYLSYLNSLRVKEYCGARDNIYHHFDRNTTVSQECKGSAASEDLSRSSRYAALNLAIMHALFGHKDEALAALNEAIMVAQEVNDNICLQYSLAWLYRLTTDNKEILIERSIAKSAELGLWCLSSLGIQALTKLKSLTTATPSSVFDLLTKSDVQNCQHSMTDILGPAYTLRAGLWSYYGHSMMTQLSSQMLLFLNTSDPVRGGIYHIGEGTCLALRNLAIGYASEGLYVESAQVLALAKDLFPPNSEHSHIWQLADLLIKFEKALFKGKWLQAQQTQKGISIFDKDEALLRKAQLLFYQGNLAEADLISKKLLDDSEVNQISPHFCVRVLLLRAELLSTTPNYTIALPSLMTCLAKSRTHHLLHLESLITVQVASIQLELGLPKQALLLLDEIFVSLLTHGTAYDRGCCCFLYARCLAFAVIQNAEMYSTDMKKDLVAALSMSNRALEFLKKIKAVQKMKAVLCWQAHIFNYMDMTEERNTVAYLLKNIEDELS